MSGGKNLGCLLVFFIPFALVGIAVTAAIPIRILVQSLGTSVIATVDKKGISTSSKHHSSSYWVAFHYTFAGQALHGSQQVNSTEYLRATVGQHVAGRAMNMLWWPVCLTTVGSINAITGMLALFATIWDAVVILIMSSLLVPVFREKRLVSTGALANGTIIAFRFRPRKSNSEYIAYGFQTQDGTEMTAEMNIDRSLYDPAKAGSAIRVLYDPAKPRRSVAYEFSTYEVVPAMR